MKVDKDESKYVEKNDMDTENDQIEVRNSSVDLDKAIKEAILKQDNES